MKDPRLLLLVLLLLPPALAAGNDRPAPLRRVGVLFWHDSPNDALAFRGVREGFALAGIRAEFREVRAEGDADRARRAIRTFEKERYDLAYAMGTSAALIARDASSRLPVVFTAVTNPVGSGVVASWEGSGTNLCGNSNWIEIGNVLSVFQAAIPGLARLGVIYNRKNPVPLEEVAEAKRYFRERPEKRLSLLEEWIDGPRDLRAAVETVLRRGAEALWIPIDIDVYGHLDEVARVTDPRHVPLLSSQASAARTLALVGVAVDYRTLGRRSVILAKRVLEGADPGSLPVGRMHSYRVIVNLASGRRAGVGVPLPLLAAADEILGAFVEDR